MQLLTAANPDELRRLVARGEFFWLDLLRPGKSGVDPLVEAIGLDTEAAQRALEFGEVPSLRHFREHLGLVFYGAQPRLGAEAELVEVHVYVSGEWVVTVRREECAALEELRGELERGGALADETVVARVLGALAESFEELIDPLDDEIDELEQAAAEASGAPGALRQRILERRSGLTRVRRLVRRQRDHVDRVVNELEALPGLKHARRHELHDVASQMIRTADRIDNGIDRLVSALDVLSSVVANRLNAIMERLTVVATIFLPLAVVTGFFGQNFTWMVDRIDSLAAFLVFGIGAFAVSGLAISLWLRARLERVTDE